MNWKRFLGSVAGAGLLVVAADFLTSTPEGVDWLKGCYTPGGCETELRSRFRVGQQIDDVLPLLPGPKADSKVDFTPGTKRYGNRVEAILHRRTFRIFPTYFCDLQLELSAQGKIERVQIVATYPEFDLRM